MHCIYFILFSSRTVRHYYIDIRTYSLVSVWKMYLHSLYLFYGTHKHLVVTGQYVGYVCSRHKNQSVCYHIVGWPSDASAHNRHIQHNNPVFYLFRSFNMVDKILVHFGPIVTTATFFGRGFYWKFGRTEEDFLTWVSNLYNLKNEKKSVETPLCFVCRFAVLFLKYCKTRFYTKKRCFHWIFFSI